MSQLTLTTKSSKGTTTPAKPVARQQPKPVTAKPQLPKGRHVDDTVLASIMAKYKFLTAGLTTPTANDYSGLNNREQERVREQLGRERDKIHELEAQAEGKAKWNDTKATPRLQGVQYVFTDRFDDTHTRVINDAGVYYQCLHVHSEEQGGTWSNDRLREDQLAAVTAILRKLWGDAGHAAKARNLCRYHPGSSCYLVPMPLNSKELTGKVGREWTYEQVDRPNLPYRLAAVEVLRTLTANDLVAYGAKPWQETERQRREREEAELKAGLAKGDPVAKLKALQLELTELARGRKWRQQELKRHLREAADHERELTVLNREENKIRRQLNLPPLSDRAKAK